MYEGDLNPPAGEGESYEATIESEIHRRYCLNELLTGKRFGEASVFPMLMSHAHRQVIVSPGWIWKQSLTCGGKPLPRYLPRDKSC